MIWKESIFDKHQFENALSQLRMISIGATKNNQSACRTFGAQDLHSKHLFYVQRPISFWKHQLPRESLLKHTHTNTYTRKMAQSFYHNCSYWKFHEYLYGKVESSVQLKTIICFGSFRFQYSFVVFLVCFHQIEINFIHIFVSLVNDDLFRRNLIDTNVYIKIAKR